MIALDLVYAKTRPFASWRSAKPALSGGLALVLLMVAAVAASHALHQSLHPSDAADQHLCLACSLSSGQLDAPEPVAYAALALFYALFVFRAYISTVPEPAAHGLSHSRAPPAH